MTTKFFKAICKAAFLLLFPLAENSWAGCGQNSVTISALPTLGGSTFQVNALNSNGQMTGFSYTSGNLAAHPFLFSNGTLTDLGTLGGYISQGFALNDPGQVVGESWLANFETHGFLFSNGNISDLGTLGGSMSSAAAINNAGQVTGSSQSFGGTEAFLYQNGAMTNLGTLGGDYSTGVAINQSGSVAGNSFTVDFQFHGFLYTGGVMTDIGTLGSDYSYAAALNDAGVVVGESSLVSGETHGFQYSSGIMTDLGTLGGSYSSAYAVNNAGHIIGSSNTQNDDDTHGFFYASGVLTDLGTLGGNFSSAAAINNLGQVVGESDTANGRTHAFLWQAGTMLDLNSLLPANSGWELISALFVNDSGRIVGYGNQNGAFRWFVLDLVVGNNHPPLAIAGPDQTVSCQTPVTLDATLSSDPDGDALTYEWSESSTVFSTASSVAVTFSLGAHVITLKVTDPCGASSQTNVVVNVNDTAAPTVTCPGAITAFADASCQAAVPSLMSKVRVNDNCSGLLTTSQNPVAETLVGLGAHLIIVTVTDSSGNTATCSTLFTVVDTTAPVVLSSPSAQTISSGANCQAAVPDLRSQVSASDNCSPSLTVSQNPGPGTFVSLGQHSVTFTITDAAGNSTTASTTLTVVDSTAPTILSSPSALTASTDANCQAAVPDVRSSVTAADNCSSSLTVSQYPAGGTLVGVGQYSLTVTVTDASGNSASQSVSFTAVDTTEPTIVNSPATLTVSANANCEASVPNVLSSIVATDNCTPANQLVLSQTPAASTVVGLGQHVITVMVTDAAGNTASHNINFIVADTTTPTIQSVSVNPSMLPTPNHSLVPIAVSVAAFDNCDNTFIRKIVSITANEPTSPGEIQITGDLTATLAATRNPSGEGRVYVITVQCTDSSGNSSTGTATVSVPKGNGNGNGNKNKP